MLEMPVCGHGTPMKFACFKCDRGGEMHANAWEEKTDTLESVLMELEQQFRKVYKKVDKMPSTVSERLYDVEVEIIRLKNMFHDLSQLELNAKVAIDQFVRKANDLKKIDARRDDVINSLCQKISDLEKRLNTER
jgi:hypothetical protein